MNNKSISEIKIQLNTANVRFHKQEKDKILKSNCNDYFPNIQKKSISEIKKIKKKVFTIYKVKEKPLNVNSLEKNLFFTECFKNHHKSNKSQYSLYSNQKIKFNIEKDKERLTTLDSTSKNIKNKDNKYSIDNIRKMINERKDESEHFENISEFQNDFIINKDYELSEISSNFKNYFTSNLKSGFISKEKCREFIDKTKEIAFHNRLNFYKKEFIKNIQESEINKEEIINNTTANLLIAEITFINNFSSEYIKYCRKVKRLKDFEISNLDWYKKRRMDIDFSIKTVEQKLQKLKETIEKFYEYKLFFTAIKNRDINLLKIKPKIDFKRYFELLKENSNQKHVSPIKDNKKLLKQATVMTKRKNPSHPTISLNNMNLNNHTSNPSIHENPRNSTFIKSDLLKEFINNNDIPFKSAKEFLDNFNEFENLNLNSLKEYDYSKSTYNKHMDEIYSIKVSLINYNNFSNNIVHQILEEIEIKKKKFIHLKSEKQRLSENVKNYSSNSFPKIEAIIDKINAKMMKVGISDTKNKTFNDFSKRSVFHSILVLEGNIYTILEKINHYQKHNFDKFISFKRNLEHENRKNKNLEMQLELKLYREKIVRNILEKNERKVLLPMKKVALRYLLVKKKKVYIEEFVKQKNKEVNINDYLKF